MGVFGPGLLLSDSVTMQPVAGRVVTVHEPGTDLPLATTPAVIATNAKGYYPQFEVSGLHTAVTIRAGGGVEEVIAAVDQSSIAVPVFPTLELAQAWEAANPGRVGLWLDTGYVPPTVYEDTFETPAASIYTTDVDGSPWTKGMWTAYGVTEAAMEMAVTGGYATHGATVGAGAGIAVNGLDMEVEVEYDLTAGATSNRQVRAFGRGNPSYGAAERAQMPVQAIVKETGQVLFEPYEGTPGVFTQLEIGTGVALAGTLRLSLAGDEARVYVNGVQIGATRTLASPQLGGAWAGFACRNTGRAHSFKATVAGS